MCSCSVLRDSTLHGKPLLKQSNCDEVSCFQPKRLLLLQAQELGPATAASLLADDGSDAFLEASKQYRARYVSHRSVEASSCLSAGGTAAPSPALQALCGGKTFEVMPGPDQSGCIVLCSRALNV
jgi:hypothetical protein